VQTVHFLRKNPIIVQSRSLTYLEIFEFDQDEKDFKELKNRLKKC
jgi:hypothetical protein